MESAGICAECDDHYGISSDGTKCETIAHCKIMIDNSQCYECEEHYGISSDGKECATISNCDRMTDNKICETCEAYFIKDN